MDDRHSYYFSGDRSRVDDSLFDQQRHFGAGNLGNRACGQDHFDRTRRNINDWYPRRCVTTVLRHNKTYGRIGLLAREKESHTTISPLLLLLLCSPICSLSKSRKGWESRCGTRIAACQWGCQPNAVATRSHRCHLISTATRTKFEVTEAVQNIHINRRFLFFFSCLVLALDGVVHLDPFLFLLLFQEATILIGVKAVEEDGVTDLPRNESNSKTISKTLMGEKKNT